MSLVGTRPILQEELRQYELHHRARIAINRNKKKSRKNIESDREESSCVFKYKYIV